MERMRHNDGGAGIAEVPQEQSNYLQGISDPDFREYMQNCYSKFEFVGDKVLINPTFSATARLLYSPDEIYGRQSIVRDMTIKTSFLWTGKHPLVVREYQNTMGEKKTTPYTTVDGMLAVMSYLYLRLGDEKNGVGKANNRYKEGAYERLSILWGDSPIGRKFNPENDSKDNKDKPQNSQEIDFTEIEDPVFREFITNSLSGDATVISSSGISLAESIEKMLRKNYQNDNFFNSPNGVRECLDWLKPLRLKTNLITISTTPSRRLIVDLNSYINAISFLYTRIDALRNNQYFNSRTITLNSLNDAGILWGGEKTERGREFIEAAGIIKSRGKSERGAPGKDKKQIKIGDEEFSKYELEARIPEDNVYFGRYDIATLKALKDKIDEFGSEDRSQLVEAKDLGIPDITNSLLCALVFIYMYDKSILSEFSRQTRNYELEIITKSIVHSTRKLEMIKKYQEENFANIDYEPTFQNLLTIKKNIIRRAIRQGNS